MMERGFYHPNHGYWQTTSDVSDSIRNGYPSGTEEIPLKPGNLHEWDGSKWVYAPPSDADMLEAERQTMQCSRFQAKAALQQIGRLDEVRDHVEANADELATLAWVEAGTFYRNSPTIKTIGAAIGLSQTEIDDLFRQAMQIRA